MAFRDEVEISYHQGGTQGLPMVNVKVYGQLPDQDEESGMTLEWAEAHLNESQIQGWWDLACDLGFQDAQDEAMQIFGEHVKCYQQGRSGGWFVVEGLGDVDEWDAVMLNKWTKFAMLTQESVDLVPWRCMNLIGLNVYEPWSAKQEKKAALAAAASLPIQASV
jgi:hypothetical protein